MAVWGGRCDQQARPPCDGRLKELSSFWSCRQVLFSQGLQKRYFMRALSQYDETLEDQAFQAAVERGISEIDAGQGLSLDELKIRLKNWRTDLSVER